MKLSLIMDCPGFNMSLKELRLLWQAAKQAFEIEERELPKGLEVNLTLCGNDDIQFVNKIYRNKDAVTDVLSFPMYEADERILPMSSLGDIVICVPRMIEQANAYGHSIQRELCFLFVHGLLHLLGYDHEISEAEEKRQFGRQEEVLANIGLNR